MPQAYVSTLSPQAALFILLNLQIDDRVNRIACGDRIPTAVEKLVPNASRNQVEMRGFVLEAETGEWILYPEPALKSCCRDGNLKEGVLLFGDVPKSSKGKCVTLVGYLDKGLTVSEVKESGAPYLGLILVAFCLVMFGFWYRSTQK